MTASRTGIVVLAAVPVTVPVIRTVPCYCALLLCLKQSLFDALAKPQSILSRLSVYFQARVIPEGVCIVVRTDFDGCGRVVDA